MCYEQTQDKLAIIVKEMKTYQKPEDVSLLFLGTPEIALYPLKALFEAGFKIAGVVSQEDKAVGREGKILMSPTKRYALSKNIPIFQPHRIRKDYEFANKLYFDVIVCMAYGQIVPMELINLAPKKAINLHGSLLPKYRGAAPIQRAIMNGERITGVTLMEMVAEMDAGRIFDKIEIPIEASDNYSLFYKKMGEAAALLIVNDLLAYLNDELPGVKQDESLVSFAYKITSREEKMPLSLSSKQAIDYIRSLSEEPGAYLLFRDKKLKIFKAQKWNEDVSFPIGTIVKNKKNLLLQLSDGVISLLDIQLEGKKRMDATSFLNGAHLEEGEMFS